MTLNYEAKAIEMTKTEAKEAGKPNTTTYNKLIELRTAFPTFEIIIKKTTRKKSTFKGLDYDYMERYMVSKKSSLIEEFYTMRGYVDGVKNDFVESASFVEIKTWFLLNFPEIEEYNSKVEKLREENKRKVEANREKMADAKRQEKKNAYKEMIAELAN